MIERIRRFLIASMGIALCLFTVYDVNYAFFSPTAQLAIFCLLGTGLCFLMFPLTGRVEGMAAFRLFDMLLAAGMATCCGYLIWQGNELAQRGGKYTDTDFLIAITGTLLVLEATRRSIGWALPILAGAFLLYAMAGPSLPDWLFTHRGYDLDRISAQCFLRTEGVFGIAMRVMFTYVFLFVVFGAFLEVSGATQFIIDFAQRVFDERNPLLRVLPGPIRSLLTAGGPAKVSVLASGLMGSLSGSAVANAVTTGTFTIPMMRSAGFRNHISGGITAAAASGGALVPPVMGAGAYMMLELVEDVTFLEIAKAALLPAILYYLSILLIVHFYSLRSMEQDTVPEAPAERRSLLQYEGIVFFGALGSLIGFLLLKYTPFRAVTYSLEVILLLTIVSPRMPMSTLKRGASVGVFVGSTALVCVLRRTLDPASLIGKLLQADPQTQLTDWAAWADAAIPAMLIVLLAGLADSLWRTRILDAFRRATRGGVSLVAASACVGIIIAVVSLTGVGTSFPNAVIPLARESLFLALAAIMVCSIILGMGLPSAVCYLLMATLIGPVLNKLGVIPLAAHLFIFYFGMMSMVTPPVALAAYASAGIAGSKIMKTGVAAFLFALVGFTLPYMFVYRPELLMMSSKPEVKITAVRDSGEADQPDRVFATLERYSQSVPNMRLTVRGADGTEQSQVSGQEGRFQLELSPGEWEVAAYRKETRPLEDGEELGEGERLQMDGEERLAVSDGYAMRLGRLVYSEDVATAGELPVQFVDERLSVAQVMVATTSAVIGIVALAAAIAGFLFHSLPWFLRVLSGLAAALILFPDRGFPVGDLRIAVGDLAGLGVLVLVAVLNLAAARRHSAVPSPQGQE